MVDVTYFQRTISVPTPGQLGGVFTTAQITGSQAPRVILLIDNLGLPRLEVDDTSPASGDATPHCLGL
jgi:hypothetical protein